VCEGTVGDKPEDESTSPPFKPTGTCFRCGQDGHWARQCRGAQGINWIFFVAWSAVATDLIEMVPCNIITQGGN